MKIIYIGAGKGSKCIEWLDSIKQSQVFAFEPHPKQFEHLLNKSKSWKYKNRLVPYRKAISHITSKSTFYHSNDISSSSLLPFDPDGIKKWKYPPATRYFKTINEETIQTLRLDSFINRMNIRIIDLLYIEGQGTELNILHSLGRKARSIKQIICKVHTIQFNKYKTQSTKDDVFKYLKKKNFVLKDFKSISNGQEELLLFQNGRFSKHRKILHNDL